MNKIVTRAVSMDLVQQRLDNLNQRLQSLENRGQVQPASSSGEDPAADVECAVCQRKISSRPGYHGRRRKKGRGKSSRRRRRRRM